MTGTIFEQCGMRLRTDLPVDLLVADGEEYDVDASWGPDTDHSTQRPAGEVLAETLDVEDDPESFWYVLTRVDGGYCARFRDCGEFEISADVTDVRVRRDPNGRHELLPILLGGTVSAMLLGLRGSTVLHASAVSVDGTVMAFAGHSGQGKSTVAALMCLGGAELVTDDLLAIETGPVVRCRGGATELRLRDPAAHLADVEADGRRRATADGRTAFTPRSSSSVARCRSAPSWCRRPIGQRRSSRSPASRRWTRCSASSGSRASPTGRSRPSCSAASPPWPRS